MDFGVEEVEEEFDDDEAMDFGAGEVGEDLRAGNGQSFRLGVVMIPSDAMSSQERSELQGKMRESAGAAKNYEPLDGSEILNRLDEEGMESCITEPLCLAGAGEDAGVDRILMGRLRSTPAGLVLTVDLFDVTNKLFVEYATASGVSGYSAVVDSVDKTVKDVFGIRVERAAPNYADEASTGTVQRVMAYSTAGIAVVALAGGIYFGMDAASLEDEVLAAKVDGGFTISQVSATRKIRDAEDSALTANILYGASAGMAVVSAILFIVEPGSDVAEPDDRRRRRRAGLLEKIDFTPQVGLGRVGMSAGFEF
ncbi:hypothetical protein [Bradymonas sediminis]|uniref:Uncharacterized protein n=1 Tax=Bradymonas sediminis TaxID=1548548 RepID=A0A2Z4FG12_9DELT|nr:hypothetical protein [Bradymonas sediminis]AWV87853.1 hypothetical protein DN745_00290 [Bradymonas sediminis]TDP73950.1 hypothetical protein DFR33_105284 [Bradymonas sediminis]